MAEIFKLFNNKKKTRFNFELWNKKKEEEEENDL